jgi:hypothetical protein
MYSGWQRSMSQELEPVHAKVVTTRGLQLKLGTSISAKHSMNISSLIGTETSNDTKPLLPVVWHQADSIVTAPKEYTSQGYPGYHAGYPPRI